VIVLDKSGSVGESNFDLSTLATTKMIGDLMSAGSDVRVGVVKYASEAVTNSKITSKLTTAMKETLEMKYAG
jgi:hypothetical protein